MAIEAIIKDKQGRQILPKTKAGLVTMPDGTTIEDKVIALERTLNDTPMENLCDAQHDAMEEANPGASLVVGNRSIAQDAFDFIIINHNTEPDDNGQPYATLQRNNILRYKSGQAAPSVNISQAQYDSVMGEEVQSHVLSLRVDGVNYATVKGAEDSYDPESVVERIKEVYALGDYGVKFALWDDTADQQVHLLLPWDTVSQDYSIYLANRHDLWLIDHQEGSDGREHTALLAQPMIYKGIDPRDWRLRPTGLTPTAVHTITKGGRRVTRCHFSTRVGGQNCKGHTGFGKAFVDNGTYPNIADMNQINCMDWARNNNADATKTFPHAEGGYHALNTLTCSLEMLHGRDMHRASLFGSGISANDGCNNEQQWLVNGGIRCREKGTTSWAYSKWSDLTIFYNQEGTRSSYCKMMRDYAPGERVMESQLAASWAAEFDIPSDTYYHMPYVDDSYRYQNVTGRTDIMDSRMGCRLYIKKGFDIPAWTATGEARDFEAETILRCSLFNGATLSGDIGRYCGGGAELVIEPETQEQCASGYSGDIPHRFYIEPDQKAWVSERSEYKPRADSFAFEDKYRLMFDGLLSGNGYSKQRIGYTLVRTKRGGGALTFMCYYVWLDNYRANVLGRKVRSELCAGASANNVLFPRALEASSSVATRSMKHGGLAQVCLGRELQAV